MPSPHPVKESLILPFNALRVAMLGRSCHNGSTWRLHSHRYSNVDALADVTIIQHLCAMHIVSLYIRSSITAAIFIITMS